MSTVPTGLFGSVDDLNAASQPAAAGSPAPEPFISQTQPPEITFGATGGPSVAMPGFYITQDDSVMVSAWNSAAGNNSVTVQLRILRPDGTLTIEPFTLNGLDALRTKASASIAQLEGFIVGVSIQAPAVAVKRGQCYVTVAIVRGAPATQLITLTLLSDYLTSSFQPSWPYSQLRPALEGPGVAYVVVGTSPPLNTAPNLIQPVRTQWLVKSICFSLTTDATAGNRSFIFDITPGAGIVFQVAGAVAQPPSSTYFYSIFPAAQFQAANPATQLLSLPPDLLVAQQTVFTVVGLSGGAGDSYSAIKIQVEEWIDV